MVFGYIKQDQDNKIKLNGLHRNDNFDDDQGLFADLSFPGSPTGSNSSSSSYFEPKLMHNHSITFENTEDGLIPIGT